MTYIRKHGPNRKWSKEEKLRIVKLNVVDNISQTAIAKEESISRGMLHGWIREYLEFGDNAFEPKPHKSGNPFAALHTSKSLSIEERQRLEIMKLRIENERLKKGYLVKGVGANKEFVSLKDVNIR